MKEETLISLRIIDDATIRAKGGVDQIEITNNMRKAFTSSHRNRKIALDQKNESEKKERALKRKAAEELENLEVMKKRILEEKDEKLRLLEEQTLQWKKLLGKK
ncbi:hypothetical protein QAD02_003255 [Eretmocerus hayati]|uniref:Uncharacterized protein n=1 Tax=Eretmocerus hayati TaxID=131215 RepID=A0ACC2NN08_9HYME|nr:hypothetical protein QAD02_003255 [Eretmocerus hayati]